MLDAYIIDRIRREKEIEREGDFVPLRIEIEPEPAPPPPEGKGEADRGSVVIDFNL
jgi:hypothetical protein